MNSEKAPMEQGPRDLDLIEAFQGGDEKAFETLVKRYQDRLFNMIFGMLRNHHEAEDVFQEVLIKVYKRLKDFRGESGFFTWLYRVGVNATWDHLRKRQRRPAFSLEAAIEEKRLSPKKLADKAAGPGTKAQWSDEVALVRAALEELNPKHRVILVLKEEEGLSYEEIARVLRCSIGTVESRIFRAREKLRKKLEPYFGVSKK